MVALQLGFAEWTITMQRNLLMLCTHQMIDNMTSRRVALTVAKPLVTHRTTSDGTWIVDATIPKQIHTS